MPKKKKSQNKPILDAPTGISKRTSTKKVIVCHCWPGVYEAAIKIKDKLSRKNNRFKKLSLSKLINIFIAVEYLEHFGSKPNFNNEILKGEN